MQAYFYELADYGTRELLAKNERFTASFLGESSDFSRFNHAKVRQAGKVTQATIKLRLIEERRNVEASLTLSFVMAEDKARLKGLFQSLRDLLRMTPEDPYLLYNEDVQSTERRMPNTLGNAQEMVARALDMSRGLDLVGIYASGGVMRGFANSFGQRNWFETYSFNLDYSLYLRADQAVKGSYAGFSWDDKTFRDKLEKGRKQLALLDQPQKAIKPGKYRVYLAPSAVHEIVEMLCWGGFSQKALKTKQSPLLKLYEQEVALSPIVSLRENTAKGVAPDFNAAGYVKPGAVELISAGKMREALISPRTAQEYSLRTNGADSGEGPQSLEMDPGLLAEDEIEAKLDQGLYVNNLWYLNFSDRSACRITGMTRFATFWVENGKIVAPVPVMRFDESALRLLGEQLIDLTMEQELLMSASTYGQRATSSQRLPGALVDQFTITL